MIMSKEYKIHNKNNLDQTWCCHEDLIEEHFTSVEGFKNHYANEWGIPATDIIIEEIDLTQIELAPLISANWEKANMIAESILDGNARAQCQYLMGTQPDNTPLQDAIASLWSAMESIWVQYATNKSRIEAGQDPNEYVVPENTPTIWDIMSLAESGGSANG
jgi:hypothetical protein